MLSNFIAFYIAAEEKNSSWEVVLTLIFLVKNIEASQFIVNILKNVCKFSFSFQFFFAHYLTAEMFEE